MALENVKEAIKEAKSNLSKTAQFVKPLLNKTSEEFENKKRPDMPEIKGNLFDRIAKIMDEKLDRNHPEVFEAKMDITEIKSKMLTEEIDKIIGSMDEGIA